MMAFGKNQVVPVGRANITLCAYMATLTMSCLTFKDEQLILVVLIWNYFHKQCQALLDMAVANKLLIHFWTTIINTSQLLMCRCISGISANFAAGVSEY